MYSSKKKRAISRPSIFSREIHTIPTCYTLAFISIYLKMMTQSIVLFSQIKACPPTSTGWQFFHNGQCAANMNLVSFPIFMHPSISTYKCINITKVGEQKEIFASSPFDKVVLTLHSILFQSFFPLFLCNFKVSLFFSFAVATQTADKKQIVQFCRGCHQPSACFWRWG